jgi:hypothetical protein
VRRGAGRLGGALWLVVVLVWFGGAMDYPLYTLFCLVTLLTFGLAFHWVDANTRRPRRTFFYLGLASAALSFPMVVSAEWSGGSIVLGAVTWAGMSLLAAIWAIHYERTEPLG